MKSLKLQSKLLVACTALVSVAAFLKADYYKPDFFPIGLTGINPTGYPAPTNCPYENTENWQWNGQVQSESTLVVNLGVNCLGCQDANSRYIGSFDTTICRNQNNYLYQVCLPSFMDDGDSANPEHIYILIFTDITDSLPNSLDSLRRTQ